MPDIAIAALTKTIEHDIQGDFKVEGHTIVINDFSYDGVGLDAFFYVGTSTGCPSGEGTRLGELEEHVKPFGRRVSSGEGGKLSNWAVDTAGLHPQARAQGGVAPLLRNVSF